MANVWHASVFTREVLDGLLRIGFLYPQQIIWNKGRTVLRLLVLENRLGLVETAENRRVLELVETVRQRRAARLALERIEYRPPEYTGAFRPQRG